MEKIKPDVRSEWPFVSLRDYLSFLDDRNRLLRISKKVDVKWELGAISRRLYLEGSDEACLLLNAWSSAEGWQVEPPYTRVVDGVYRNLNMFEEILDVPKERMFEEWEKRLTKLVQPRVVSDGPCKEVVLRGDDVDLHKLPVELCTARQAGPFITLGVAHMKHPDSKMQNAGIYRLQVQSRNHTGMLIVPTQHSAVIYAKYGVLDQPMPMAVSIGVDPLLGILGAGPMPADTPELWAWGAFTGEPMEVVPCETVDLFVPAYSEYVLEGEVLQDVREREGPFGEYTGFYSGIRDLPIFRVNCITHRKHPIFQTINMAKPPFEGGLLAETAYNLELTRILRQFLPEVTVVRSLSCHGLVSVIQLDKERRYKGLAQRAGALLSAMKPQIKNIFVIDTDIDVWDVNDIMWAFATRCQGHKSVQMIPNMNAGRLDPSEPFGQEEGIGCKMIIDCTEPFPPFHAPYMRGVAGPHADSWKLVESQWANYFSEDL